MKDRRFILGIPIDNLRMDTICKRIFQLVERNKQEKCSSYIATVNVDFIVNTLKFDYKAIKN
ncbi:MAG: hypothetical protein AAF518_27570, partial [Spirochaetota bacterium]